MDTIMYSIAIIIYIINIIYFIIKAYNYKSDERGTVIFQKASRVVYGTIFLIFFCFVWLSMLSNSFDVEDPVFSLNYIRIIVTGIMAFLSTINSLSIMYFEKKI